MKEKRKLIFRVGALLLVLLIAAAMMVTGRGHTVYFDNKTIEYNGQSCEAYQKVEVFVKDERVAKLSKRDRGMVETMGQKFSMTLNVIENKADAPETYTVSLTLPYNMDGILINLPALLNGLPADAYLSELEIVVPEEETGESQEGEGVDLMEEVAPADI